MEIETKLILNIWRLFLPNKYVSRCFDLIIKRIREICQIPSESGQKLLVYFGEKNVVFSYETSKPCGYKVILNKHIYYSQLLV